ncbi:MAG: alpha/beta hydrolase, partial [Planctomycetota bacterium]
MLVPDHPMPEIKKRSKFWPRLRMGLFFFSIAYMLLSFGITWHLIFGIKRSFVSHPSRRGIPATDVEFRAEDGKTIRGWLSEIEHRPTVIMAHGNGGYRAELAAVYQHVSLKVGLGFLTFDFRAAGQSDGRFSSYGIEESKDLRAAIQFLRNRGKPWKQIGLVAYDM